MIKFLLLFCMLSLPSFAQQPPQSIKEKPSKLYIFGTKTQLALEFSAIFLVYGCQYLWQKRNHKIEAEKLAKAIDEDNADEVTRILGSQKVNLEAKGGFGYTLLHCAVAKGNREVASVLLFAGASPNSTTNMGLTPLHFAEETEMAELLIGYGANVNAKDNQGSTPLLLAVTEGRGEMGCFLIKHGADLNVKYNKGNTLLHIAAMKNVWSLAVFLIKVGANVNVRNDEGDTPLDVAMQQGSQDVIDCLGGMEGC